MKTSASWLVLAVCIVVVWFVMRPQIEAPPPTRTVEFFYYNAEQDKDEQGQLLCSQEGLVPVSREVAADASTQNILEQFLRGELSDEERAAGVTTEFPLERLTLDTVQQQDNTLILTFSDPLNKTSGGSCRASILWAQIEATTKVIKNVEQVQFLPEELFQP